MWRWLLLIVLVVAISAAAAWISMWVPLGESGPSSSVPYPSGEADPNRPQPSLVLDAKPEYDFGVMAQQSKDRHEWVIRNEGPGPLTLTGTQPSCSCTVIDPKPGQTITVAPGESYTLKIEWETRQFSDKYRKEARVLTNDPKHPTIDFIVSGIVQPPIIMYPPEGLVDVQSISNESEQVVTVLVASADRDDMKIVEAATSRPELFQVAIKPMTDAEKADAGWVEAKSAYRLDIHIQPQLRLGSFREELVVKTSHPLREEVRFTISGKVTGPISITPPTGLRLPNVISAKGGSGTVVLTVRGQEETTFSAEDLPEGVEVKVSPLLDREATATGDAPTAATPVRRYRLEVSVKPGTPPGMIQEPITLKTDHPRASELVVPLQVRILSQG